METEELRKRSKSSFLFNAENIQRKSLEEMNQKISF